MELDGPATLLVEILALSACNVVADNLDIPARAQQNVQESSDDGLHATAQNDNGNIVLARPVVELGEAGVEHNVLLENFEALVKGGVDAVEHFLKGVAEVHMAEQDPLVGFDALRLAESQVVGHEVIGVGGGHGAVEICEKYELGVGGQGGCFAVCRRHFENECCIWSEMTLESSADLFRTLL